MYFTFCVHNLGLHQNFMFIQVGLENLQEGCTTYGQSWLSSNEEKRNPYSQSELLVSVYALSSYHATPWRAWLCLLDDLLAQQQSALLSANFWWQKSREEAQMVFDILDGIKASNGCYIQHFFFQGLVYWPTPSCWSFQNVFCSTSDWWVSYSSKTLRAGEREHFVWSVLTSLLCN